MKFICDSCQQKYHLDDSRVVGRTLQIRCRQCGSVIIVRDPHQAHPDSHIHPPRPGSGIHRWSSATDKARRTTAGLDDVAWHYSVNGQTYGPFNEDDLIAKFLSGQLGDEAYVWNPDLEGWRPAAEIPVFTPALEEGRRRNPRHATIDVPAFDVQVLRGLTEETPSVGHSDGGAVSGGQGVQPSAAAASAPTASQRTRGRQHSQQMAAQAAAEVAEVATNPALARLRALRERLIETSATPQSLPAVERPSKQLDRISSHTPIPRPSSPSIPKPRPAVEEVPADPDLAEEIDAQFDAITSGEFLAIGAEPVAEIQPARFSEPLEPDYLTEHALDAEAGDPPEYVDQVAAAFVRLSGEIEPALDDGGGPAALDGGRAQPAPEEAEPHADGLPRPPLKLAPIVGAPPKVATERPPFAPDEAWGDTATPGEGADSMDFSVVPTQPFEVQEQEPPEEAVVPSDLADAVATGPREITGAQALVAAMVPAHGIPGALGDDGDEAEALDEPEVAQIEAEELESAEAEELELEDLEIEELDAQNLEVGELEAEEAIEADELAQESQAPEFAALEEEQEPAEEAFAETAPANDEAVEEVPEDADASDRLLGESVEDADAAIEQAFFDLEVDFEELGEDDVEVIGDAPARPPAAAAPAAAAAAAAVGERRTDAPPGPSDSLVMDMKKVHRSGRTRRWLYVGLGATLLAAAIILPRLGLDSDDPRLAVMPPSPVEPEAEEAEPPQVLPYEPRDDEHYSMSAALRQSRSQLYASLARANEQGNVQAMQVLETEGSGVETAGSAESRSDDSGRRRGEERTTADGEPDEAASNSRFARLREARTVTVTHTMEAPEEREGVARAHSDQLDADYFAEDLSRVARAVQRCHEMQMRDASSTPLARVVLNITVQPDGGVSLGMDSALDDSTFGRCLQTRHQSWSFREFEGEPVTLRHTYALQ